MGGPGQNFSVEAFLSTAGAGRTLVSFGKGTSIFAQGDRSDAVFVVLTGIIRLSARARGGKDAALDLLAVHDFVGKDSIANQPIRTTSARALTDCQLLRIDSEVMILALAHEVKLSNALCAYLLTKSLRHRQDLVGQRCDSSEERLACILHDCLSLFATLMISIEATFLLIYSSRTAGIIHWG